MEGGRNRRRIPRASLFSGRIAPGARGDAARKSALNAVFGARLGDRGWRRKSNARSTFAGEQVGTPEPHSEPISAGMSEFHPVWCRDEVVRGQMRWGRTNPGWFAVKKKFVRAASEPRRNSSGVHRGRDEILPGCIGAETKFVRGASEPRPSSSGVHRGRDQGCPACVGLRPRSPGSMETETGFVGGASGRDNVRLGSIEAETSSPGSGGNGDEVHPDTVYAGMKCVWARRRAAQSSSVRRRSVRGLTA